MSARSTEAEREWSALGKREFVADRRDEIAAKPDAVAKARRRQPTPGKQHWTSGNDGWPPEPTSCGCRGGPWLRSWPMLVPPVTGRVGTVMRPAVNGTPLRLIGTRRGTGGTRTTRPCGW